MLKATIHKSEYEKVEIHDKSLAMFHEAQKKKREKILKVKLNNNIQNEPRAKSLSVLIKQRK